MGVIFFTIILNKTRIFKYNIIRILNHIRIFFLAITIFCFADALAQQEPPHITPSETIQVVDGKEYYFHAVQKGHTLFSIAKAYGVSQEDIIIENPEIRSGLKMGQLIKIPVEKSELEPETKKQDKVEYIEHKVRRKETLYGISRQYEVSQEFILNHNPEARKGLKTNQVLKIPVINEEEEIADKENFTKYTAKQGDTPYGISRMFNLPLDTLAAYNDDFDDGVKAGQIVIIPKYKYLQKAEQDLSMLADSILNIEDAKTESGEMIDNDYCSQPELKSHYNVALMLPLYLDKITDEDIESEKLPLNHPSFEFVHFYEGLLIALDSVEKSGVEITLHVFDVCKDPLKVLEAVNSSDFSKMDLIIGPFYEESLKKVAYYAERNNIAMISPYHSDVEQLKFFNNIFQLMPSLDKQLKELADFIINNKYNDQNILLIHSEQQQVIDNIKWFKNYLNANINRRQYLVDSINLSRIDPYFYKNSYVGEKTSSFYLFNDSLIIAQENASSDSLDTLVDYMNHLNIKEISMVSDSLGTIVHSLDSLRENIVVALVGGNVHVSNVLRELHNYKDTFDVMVFGTPQWRYLESIDLDYFHSLDVHLFAPNFIDYSDANIQDFVFKFRERFYTEPERDAFIGMKTGYYFFNALSLYGREFYKCIGALNGEDFYYNPFYFQKPFGEEAGWENKKSTIITFKNYRMVDVRKPFTDDSIDDSYGNTSEESSDDTSTTSDH